MLPCHVSNFFCLTHVHTLGQSGKGHGHDPGDIRDLLSSSRRTTCTAQQLATLAGVRGRLLIHREHFPWKHFVTLPAESLQEQIDASVSYIPH